jgi:hypothetical protein
VAKYLSAVESAKLLRQALKESFPGVKFSVRSDNNSIDVRWVDGPNTKQVDAVADQFEGGYFDGMIDYAGCKYHKLDGEQVRFGSKYVFCQRECSAAYKERAARVIKAKYGYEIDLAKFDKGELYNVFPSGGEWSNNNSAQCMMNAELSKISDRVMVAESAMLKRVEFAGDDGYGAGTVGPDGKGGNQCYVAMSEARDRQAAQRQLEQMKAAGGVLQ